MMKQKHVVKAILSVVLTFAMVMGMMPLSGFVVETKAQDVVKYIDENGVEQECTEYTVLEGGETTLEGGWYVVKDTNPDGVDALYTGDVTIYGNVSIILCDGAELRTVGEGKGFICNGRNKSLTIYGQSAQSGKMTLLGELQDGIYVFDGASVTINGGHIVFDSDENEVSINDSTFTINGGKVDVGEIFDNDDSTFTINGGQVKAGKIVVLRSTFKIDGGQVEAGDIDGTYIRALTIGYRNITDYIKIDTYNYGFEIASGKAFLTDAGAVIKGNVEYESAPNGKKLVPAPTLTIQNGIANGNVSVAEGVEDNNGVRYVAAGETVDLTVTPDDGYKLDTLSVVGASGTYIPITNSSFTMPAENVTINATFRGSNDDAVYPASDDNTLSGWITRTVSIADKATVTLSNATISGGITCEGDATIILAGENTVTAQSNHAGIYVRHKDDIDDGDEDGYTLIINGDGKLDVTGGENGAGIGGYGYNYENRHSCGNIIINSGEVTATGGKNGAGIGGAYFASCGSITINDGVVIATGGDKGAGIGGAYVSPFRNIEINGGSVTAQGGTNAAGIGSGCAENVSGTTGGNITINGGTVSATGNGYGTGIGCGGECGCGDILISGGDDIEAIGGESAAGIGSANAYSKDSICGSITITDGIKILSVTGGENAKYSIGNGEEYSGHTSFCGTVTIGGVVTGFISEKKFITKPCLITFAADGGEGTMDSVKFMENIDYELPTCTFTATTGKMFKEWSVKIGNADAVTKAAEESVKITANTVVTAVWKDRISTDIPSAIGNLIYNGSEQTGVVASTGYTITGNKATNAGTYTATAVLDAEYKWSDGSVSDKEITWSIAKATPSYEAPTELKATTGQTLANVTLPDGWTWADKTLSVGNVGTNVFKATYTPADTTNYNAVENVELSVVVSKATSNTNGGSTNPGGGSTSPSGGGSSSGNTDNKDTTEKTTTPVTEKTTNADGSVTEKTTTTNTDGSKTETSKTTAKDGTITEAEKTTAKDGTVKETEKTTATDGTITESEKTTLTDGSVKEVEKTTSTDGTIVEKTSETDKDGSAVVSEKVTEKDGSSSETTVTVDSNGKAKSIVATDSDGKKDSQTVAFDVKGNKATVSSIDTSTGKVTIPETIEAPDGKTYTVTKLDKDAFDGQKLKELSLPDTIKVINPKALENTGLKTLNLTGKNTKLKKNCLKNTNKNLVIKVTTKAEKRNIEKQLKKAGNPKAKVKVSKKK